MTIATHQYKGFTIVVTPTRDHDDLWDFSYRISKTGEGDQDGDPAASITRDHSAGGHASMDAACEAGALVAHTEVDNLLALAARPG